jgi:PAS domain S-box-containing protein
MTNWATKLAAVVVGALVSIAFAQTSPTDPVALQLPDAAQFRFAGYYAALNRGYYAEEGLQVSIRGPGGSASPADSVVNDTAQFGVLGSELVRERLEGKPVVVLATILQESGYCLVSAMESMITAPADLTGKRVILTARDVELRAFLRSSGIAMRDITFVDAAPDQAPMDALVGRSVDAVGGYLTFEPNVLRLRGMPVAVMRPVSFGVDFCGDSLFTSEEQVRLHPERVAAFRRACLKGWRYALDHRDEVIEWILRRHGAAGRGLTRDFLRFEANAVRDLVLPDLIPIGQVNQERFDRMARTLSGLGMVPDTPPKTLEKFFYDPNPPNTRRAAIRWLTLSLAAALVVVAIVMLWSLQLRGAVARRTREYQESTRRLIEAQAIGHVGDWELDPVNGHAVWSDEMYRLFEVDPSKGPPPFDELMQLFSPEDQARIRTAIERATKEGVQVRVDSSPRLSSGRVRHLSGIITPVRDEEGKVFRLIGVAQDITQRKIHEADLVSSEARYRTLVDHAPDAIVTLDVTSGRFIDANPRASDLYGLSKEQLLTKGPVDLSPAVQADGRPSADSAREKIEAAIRGDIPTFRWDHRHSDGSIVPCEIRLVSIPGKDRPLIRGSITDISERLQREDALKKRTAELERSNRELERFAYVASHDLQEPLRMVTSFTQLLSKRYRDKLGPDADEFIGFAVDGAKRMQALIDDLLAYSRAGRQGVKLAHVEADRALDDALTNLKPAIEGARAVIVRDPLPVVVADATQFVQLFQNLVSNAVKFRAQVAPEIHISARRENGEWVFSVQDNGIGIDPAHKNKLFVMFQRLHPRHQYPGTGIGLALCKMIVERLGGRIWVESMPGQGATFRFTVPATEDEGP